MVSKATWNPTQNRGCFDRAPVTFSNGARLAQESSKKVRQSGVLGVTPKGLAHKHAPVPCFYRRRAPCPLVLLPNSKPMTALSAIAHFGERRTRCPERH